MAKLVALFGNVSSKQLNVLKKAGYTGLTTDATGELETREAAQKAGFPTIIRAAAWNTLDHPLSQVATSVGRDGNARDYNRNGGFTRDVLMIGEAHTVIVGAGIGGSRLDLIRTTAEELDRPYRELVEVPAEAAVDVEALKAELAELPF